MVVAFGRPRLSFAAFLTAFGLFLTPAAAEKVVLQLHWHPDFQFAGYYAALWQGYYADAGLDVEIRKAFDESGEHLRAFVEVGEGRADFGVSGLDLLIGRETYDPLTVIAPIFQESPLIVYAKEGTRLTSPADLNDLNVGMFRRGGVGDAVIKTMLTNAGLDPETDMPQVTTTWQTLPEIMAGRLDAAVYYTPKMGWVEKTLGTKTVQLKPSNFGAEFYGDMLFTRRGLIEQAPEMVEAFRQASLKGWRYALTHSHEMADRIAGELAEHQVVDDPDAYIHSQIGAVAQLTHYPVVPLGSNDLGRWQRIHASLAAAGLIAGDPPTEEFVYDPARAERRSRQMMWIAMGIVGLLGISLAIVAWIVTLRRSVTARTRDLARSENRYALAIAGTNDGIWELDLLTDQAHRSPRWYQILGYQQNELDSHREAFNAILHPDDAERHKNAVRAHLETNVPFDMEVRLRHRSGEYIWVRTKGQAIRSEDGTPLRMAGAISDITDLKDAELELRESEERFRAVFDNSPTAIFLKGLDGRFQFVNKQFEAWYGLSAADVIGKTSDEFFPREFAEDSIVEDQAVLKFGELQARQMSALFHDGSEHTITVTKFPVRGLGGEIIGVGTINTDVTDQLRVEEHLRQAQKMEAVGLLTGGIAHEFNNLLTVVVGNIELIESQLPEGGDLKRFASTAMKGAIRGAEITQRLLTFSRKQKLAIVAVDLNDLILGLHDMLQRTLGETIVLETVLAKNLTKTMADRGQIEGALLNFVLNSRDAMPKGGTIIVRTSISTLDAEAAANADVGPGEYVSMEVADTGHGMTAETVEQSFEPFFTTKDVGEGTGLGLSVVYGFAKQSGGFVEIDSEVGRGTTVRLSLPCLVGKHQVIEEPVQIKAEPARRRAEILVVEDDLDVRRLVVSLMTDLGHDTVEAGDGKTALLRLDEHPGIDLLFTDVVLPHGMSGQDVAREARRRRPDLKIVFTSGYPATGDGELLEDDERTAFVRKPYRKSELAETLATALNL